MLILGRLSERRLIRLIMFRVIFWLEGRLKLVRRFRVNLLKLLLVIVVWGPLLNRVKDRLRVCLIPVGCVVMAVRVRGPRSGLPNRTVVRHGRRTLLVRV